MRILVAAFCAIGLVACDTPPPDFAGLAKQRLTVGKSVFDVRIDGDVAQAIRLNPEWAPRPMSVMPRALVAIEQASGCTVKRMDGDQVIIEARLRCSDAQVRSSRPREYRCDVSVLNEYHADVECVAGI